MGGNPSMATYISHHISNTSLGVAWWFADPAKYFSQLWWSLAWMKGTNMYRLHPRLVKTFHASTRSVKRVAIHPWQLVPHITSHPPCRWLGGLQILQNIGPQLWWYVAWMEGAHIYVLYPRLARPLSYIHKTCGIYGHPSMPTGTLDHNPHFHVDVMVVLQILPDLGPHIPGWRASLCMDFSLGLSDLAYAPTRHVRYMTTHPWPLILVSQNTPP